MSFRGINILNTCFSFPSFPDELGLGSWKEIYNEYLIILQIKTINIFMLCVEGIDISQMLHTHDSKIIIVNIRWINTVFILKDLNIKQK